MSTATPVQPLSEEEEAVVDVEAGSQPVDEAELLSPAERKRREREAEREKLRTSKFDVVTSLFVALIAFIGLFVSMLFIIWITSRWTWEATAIEPIIENPAGRGDNAEGFERDFEPPGEEEVEDLLEPTMADTIEAVTDAVSSVAASLVSADTDQAATTQGAGGAGDSRPPGPEGEGDDIVPRFERWQLEFEASDIGSYATQLDQYAIELGVLGGGKDNVVGAKNLSGGRKNGTLPTPRIDKGCISCLIDPHRCKSSTSNCSAKPEWIPPDGRS